MQCDVQGQGFSPDGLDAVVKQDILLKGGRRSL